jgi:hypothetical protein
MIMLMRIMKIITFDSMASDDICDRVAMKRKKTPKIPQYHFVTLLASQHF